MHLTQYLYIAVLCVEGDVRLQNGTDYTQGRPEICIGEEWKTICDQGWSLNDANVLCGQLGFASNGKCSSRTCSSAD